MTYRDLSGRPQDAPEEMSELLQGVYMPGELWGAWLLFLGAQAGSRGSRFLLMRREPTVNWFFVHDGKPLGSRLLRRLRAR